MLLNIQRIILLIIITFPKVIFAQQQIKHTNQQWIQFYHQHIINKNYNIIYDCGLRKIDENYLAVALCRVGLGYKITSFLNGATGIANFNVLNNNTVNRLELRPYQEISIKKLNLLNVDITNRFRTEYRHFTTYENGHQIARQSNFRFRYKIGLSKDIYSISDIKSFSISIANEIFINASKGVLNKALDNNRIISGLSYKNNNITYSINYTYQYGNNVIKNCVEKSDIIWFTINLQTIKKHE